MKPDYMAFYNLEPYLFESVGKRFRESGELSPLDLFLILHWKSPRARKKARDRLKKLVEERSKVSVEESFKQATQEIARSLYHADNSEDRLKILMKDWQFRLPTATAILTVLYPDDFTVWDARVRGAIEFPSIREDYSERSWTRIWGDYIKFKRAVIENVLSIPRLRDKDRYLWGKSLAADIERELRG